MVYLDKELVRHDSILRDILDEEEVIFFSKIFMQGKRRERIRKSIIHLLEEWLWRKSVSFVMEFICRWKRRKRCSWHPKSIASISKRWNRGWKWLVKPFLIVQFNMQSFLRWIIKGNIQLVQRPCICCINRFARIRQEGEGTSRMP